MQKSLIASPPSSLKSPMQWVWWAGSFGPWAWTEAQAKASTRGSTRRMRSSLIFGGTLETSSAGNLIMIGMKKGTTALSVAIVGAGMGGLAAAAALRKIGAEVRVYEQASRFARIGAGIQMLPNSMKVLRGLGIEEKLRGFAFPPRSHLNRVWDSGEVQSELPMPESRYDAPYLCMHRGDLHEALLAAVPVSSILLNKKLLSLKNEGEKTILSSADGSSAEADV